MIQMHISIYIYVCLTIGFHSLVAGFSRIDVCIMNFDSSSINEMNSIVFGSTDWPFVAVVSKLKVEFNYSTIRISLSMFSKTLYQRVFECREFESDVNFN